MTRNIDVTVSLSRWCQSLVGIAQTGLAFANSPFYNLLFYCRLEGGELGSQTAEILDTGFFGRHNLPQPLSGDGEP
jgi:hypothetical protein